MQIEVAAMMQVRVSEDTDLEDLGLEIGEEGLRFVSQGRVVASTSQIEGYYIGGIESEADDWNDSKLAPILPASGLCGGTT